MSHSFEWTAIFEKHGRVVYGKTGEPLLLQGADRVWLVRSGCVDVFLVRVDKSGSDDSLRPLFRVETGHLLFGFAPSVPAGWAVCAVGAPGHELIELDRRVWAETLATVSDARRSAVDGLERWIGRLPSILLDRSPTNFTELSGAAKLEVASGQTLYAGQATQWVRAQGTQLRLLGRDAALLANDQTQEGWVPLPPACWVTCANAGEVWAMTGEQALESGNLLDGQDAFHRLILSTIIVHITEQDRAESMRLARKMDHEAEYLGLAMQSLAGVLGGSEEAGTAERTPGGGVVAAMRVIGNVAGFKVNVPASHQHGVSSDAGAHRDEVAEVTEASHIRRRLVALKGEWWLDGGGPLLGFWEDGRVPVALLPARKGYMVHEPGKDAAVPVDADVANRLSPFAFSFFRSFGSRQMNLLDLMKFGSHGLVADYLWVIGTGVGVGLLGMVVPMVTGMLFDSVIPGAERGQLAQLTLALVACAFATAMFEMTRGFALLRAEGVMDSVIQAGVWDRLLRLPMPFFRGYSAGDLATRANGINAIRQALSGSTLSSIFSAVFSAFNLILLFYYSVKLALVAVGLVFVAVLVTVGVNLLALRQERKLTELSGRLSGMVFQFLGAIAKLRATGSETRAFHQWAELFSTQQRHQFKAQMARNAVVTFNAVFPVVSNIVLFGMIAFFLKEEKSFSTGNFLAFNAAFGGLTGAMLSATATLTSVLNIVPVYERAKPILLAEPEIQASKSHPGTLSGEIEINQLGFRYSSDGPQILSDISVHINPGEFVAIVGSSGSGKSTLLRLLLGFEAPTSGSIYFDRQDMAGLDLGAMRRQFGVVLQNGQLLAGDIFTNIIGSAATLTLDHAWDAATQAGIADDIRNMPMGMHTVVSDGGGTLSGGQRQRILIARAIVNRPRILLFDEATSALDNRAQAMVSESLERLNATRIVIAHRLSTIVNADRILVLEKGRLVQSGKYAELMSQPGLFAELAKRQIA